MISEIDQQSRLPTSTHDRCPGRVPGACHHWVRKAGTSDWRWQQVSSWPRLLASGGPCSRGACTTGRNGQFLWKIDLCLCFFCRGSFNQRQIMPGLAPDTSMKVLGSDCQATVRLCSELDHIDYLCSNCLQQTTCARVCHSISNLASSWQYTGIRNEVTGYC